MNIDTGIATPAHIVRLLARTPLFGGLCSAELDRLAEHASLHEVDRGAVIYRAGELCQGLHLVASGQVKLCLASAKGHEKVVEIVDPGQTFGTAVVFTGAPYVASAQALRDSSLLLIPRRAVLDELDRGPEFCQRMLAALSRRVQRFIGDIEAYSLHTGRTRVVDYLLGCDAAQGHVPDPDGARSLQLAHSKGTVASRLNLTQEHFSRILHQLSEAGLIRVERRTIHIPDVQRLRAAAD